MILRCVARGGILTFKASEVPRRNRPPKAADLRRRFSLATRGRCGLVAGVWARGGYQSNPGPRKVGARGKRKGAAAQQAITRAVGGDLSKTTVTPG